MTIHQINNQPINPQQANVLTEWETKFDEAANALQADQIAIRRHLHQHPEPSGEERITSKYIANQLEQLELQPTIHENGLGVSAEMTIGNPTADSPTIALRADIDALRMQDEKDVEYKSQCRGINHACGHDAHTTIVLGVAMAASRMNASLADDVDGGVKLKFIFQPAEESCEGARWLVDQNVLAGVDAILGLHVAPEFDVGHVGIRYGVLTANCDEVDFIIHGHGGHAARPHHTLDPIATSATLLNALYKFLPRAVDSRLPAVFSIGQIEGGYAPNVIPERVTLKGTLRTIDSDARVQLKQKIEDICNGIATASGTSIDVTFSSPLASVVNQTRPISAWEIASQRLLGAENRHIIDHPSMGGEDFSVYLEQVPGAMIRLGCAVPNQESPYLHSPIFDLDEQTLIIGSKLMFRAAMLLAN